MKIGEALPWVLERQYPIIKPEFSLLTVLYLLRMRDIDAVPITPRGGRSRKAVFGYSSLSRMVSLEPKAFAALLRGPCEAASQYLATRKAGDQLVSIFEAFAARKFGFALLYKDANVRTGGSLVSLSDLLELYRNQTLMTDMTVGDVATPIYSVPGDATLREAVGMMFRQRFRRVFIEGERRCVSDRDIIYEVFSPSVLDDLEEREVDTLATKIGTLRGSTPELALSGDPVAKAALRLGRQRGECMITRGGSVVTPWDVLMKPWLAGRLTVS